MPQGPTLAPTIQEAQAMYDVYGTVFRCNADSCIVSIFDDEEDMDAGNFITVFNYNWLTQVGSSA